MTALSAQEAIPYSTLLQHESALLATERQIEQAVQAIEQVDRYGANHATMTMLGATRLLSQTALSSIALESMSPRLSQDNLAIEALTTETGEKSAAWAAKILHVLKNASQTLLAIISPVMNKVIDLAEDLKAVMKDKVYDAEQVIKAHPAKTVFALIGAATAALGILALCGSSFPGGTASREMFLSFFRKMSDQLGKISWGSGKIQSAMGPTGSVTIAVPPLTKPVAQTAQSLGWTGPTVNELCDGSAKLARNTVRGTASFGWRAAKFTVNAVPKAFRWGDKFRRVAPHFVHKVTRSKAVAHAAYIGLSALFYGFCFKVFLLASRILYEICSTVGIILKSTIVLFF